MRIAITCPGFARHGGIRIILEWANRLSEDNTVFIVSTHRNIQRPHWFKLSGSIPIYNDLKKCDCLIICSPHGIDLQHHPLAPGKIFIFLQMMEHLFRPLDRGWRERCEKFYTSPNPLILGAYWNFDWCVNKFGRTGPTYYVGNGVNLKDFPIRQPKKDGKTILLESPISTNPVKDTDQVALKVATRLYSEGYRIVGYGADMVKSEVFSIYFDRPTLDEMNLLYSQATILLKATHYDARALAPMEAMTKRCVTARAITLGDDDLIHNVTAMRCGYDEEALYYTAKTLLTDQELRERLSAACLDYVQAFSWEYWFRKIKAILQGKPESIEHLLTKTATV